MTHTSKTRNTYDTNVIDYDTCVVHYDTYFVDYDKCVIYYDKGVMVYNTHVIGYDLCCRLLKLRIPRKQGPRARKCCTNISPELGFEQGFENTTKPCISRYLRSGALQQRSSGPTRDGGGPSLQAPHAANEFQEILRRVLGGLDARLWPRVHQGGLITDGRQHRTSAVGISPAVPPWPRHLRNSQKRSNQNRSALAMPRNY